MMIPFRRTRIAAAVGGLAFALSLGRRWAPVSR